jgi:hypothetical protein
LFAGCHDSDPVRAPESQLGSTKVVSQGEGLRRSCEAAENGLELRSEPAAFRPFLSCPFRGIAQKNPACPTPKVWQSRARNCDTLAQVFALKGNAL